MTRIRVYISTTEAPAEIQRIAEEDPEIRSVICLDGKAVELPVSAAYDNFVRRPTGVIEDAFGHASYRVDVSARITEGLSWQLGLFLGHALAREGRLAGKGEAAERVVLATGEVDRDLQVRPVDHIADKARVAAPLFRAAAERGETVILFLPAANRADLGDPEPGCKPVPVETVHDALAWLGVQHLPRAAAASLDAAALQPVPKPDAPPHRPARGWRLIYPVAALVVALAALAWWMLDLGVLEWRLLAERGAYRELDARLAAVEEGGCRPCRWVAAAAERRLRPPAPAEDGLSLGATAVTVPRFRSCHAMDFQPDLVDRTPLALGLNTDFRIDLDRRLCVVEYALTNEGPALSGLLVAAVAGAGADFRLAGEPEAGTVGAGAQLRLTMDIPARSDGPLQVRLFAAVGTTTRPPNAPWVLQKLTERLDGALTPEAFTRRLARVGLTPVGAAHQIAPPPPRFQ